MISKTFTNPKSATITEFIESALADCQDKASSRCLSIGDVVIPEMKDEGLYSVDGGGVPNSYSYSAQTTALSVAWWTNFKNQKIVRVCVARTLAKKAAYGNTTPVKLCESGWAGVLPERATTLAKLRQDRITALVCKYAGGSYHGVKDIIVHAPGVGLIVKKCNGLAAIGSGKIVRVTGKFADKKSKFYQERTASELVQAALEVV